jgi:hypothetical protein
VDATAPSAVSNLSSTSHSAESPSTDSTIDLEWTAATDNLSGVIGYAVDVLDICHLDLRSGAGHDGHVHDIDRPFGRPLVRPRLCRRRGGKLGRRRLGWAVRD